MSRTILITGGQRSGKSQYAEQLALSLSPNPVYVATARVCDDEFRERVRRHQARRGPEWTNIEEPCHLSDVALEGRVAVIDCITLWLTNLFFAETQGSDLPDGEAMERVLATARREFDTLTRQEATLIFVTNEIGSGGTSTNPLQRRFTDLQGWMNQYIADHADQVTLMVSGIPLKIKGKN